MVHYCTIHHRNITLLVPKISHPKAGRMSFLSHWVRIMDHVSPRSGFSGCLGCKTHDASRSHEEILVKVLQHGGYFGIVNHTYLGSRFSFMDILLIYLPPLILNRLDRTFTMCKMTTWCLLPSSPLCSMILMEI